MTSLRYHRHYLWIFFYMSFILMVVGLILDVYCSTSSTEKTDEFKTKMPRFLGSLVPFFFSGISMVILNNLSKSTLRFDLLETSRKSWFSRFMKVKDFKKKIKQRNFISFMFVNAAANFISFIPAAAFVISSIISTETAKTLFETHKIFDKWFFVISLLIKYSSWYVTLFVSRFSIFWGKKRLRSLI